MRHIKTIRQIMRRHNKREIWVNNHPTVPTVKCYESLHGDARLIEELTVTLDKYKVKYRITRTPSPRYSIRAGHRIKVHLLS